MEDYPRNLAEFEARFASEQACREYLCQLRWPEGFRCPRCGHDKTWAVRTVLLQCASCGHQASATAGTIFQDTRKPLQSWFRAMWWLTSQKNGASALGLQRVLGLGSYKTAWRLHKLRPGRDRLSETYLEGRAGPPNRRESADCSSGRGRWRRHRTSDAHDSEQLDGLLGESVEPGSVVHTDGSPRGELPGRLNCSPACIATEALDTGYASRSRQPRASRASAASSGDRGATSFVWT